VLHIYAGGVVVLVLFRGGFGAGLRINVFVQVGTGVER